MANTITLALIPEVQFGFDPTQHYEFEEIPYPFNEENEDIRAAYGNDFRGVSTCLNLLVFTE